MDVGLLGVVIQVLRRLAKSTTIRAGIIGLVVFYSLTGCTDLKSTSSIKIATTATSQSQSSPWKLVWSDDFHGSAGDPPDQNKWTADIGGNGWGDKQLEYNTDNQNAYQDGKGNLVLEARKVKSSKLRCWYGPCKYTSARISTRGHFSFTYGLLLARIKLPRGQGIWPAFWLLGSNYEQVGWPACGEIDVMENIGQKEPATIHGSVHGPKDFSQDYTLQHGAFTDDYHIFGIQWDPNYISFIMDDTDYFTLQRKSFTNRKDWVYDHPFDIILDLSVGGPWPGSPDATTVFPQKMIISYVNLYAKK